MTFSFNKFMFRPTIEKNNNNKKKHDVATNCR